MDVQQIRFNQELFKNKIKLEKYLKMVNEEIMEFQKECNHIIATIGYDEIEHEDLLLAECILCRSKKIFDTNSSKIIHAEAYKRRKYGNGLTQELREERIRCLQELMMKIIDENPNSTQEELVLKINQEIKNDEEKDKVIKKIKL